MLTIVCSAEVLLKLDLRILKLAMELKKNILEIFGDRVRELRASKGISQEELGYKADLHRTYIGMIERAEKNITLINIEKIAIALGVSINELFITDHPIKKNQEPN